MFQTKLGVKSQSQPFINYEENSPVFTVSLGATYFIMCVLQIVSKAIL